MTEKEKIIKILERIGAIVDDSEKSELIISDKCGGGSIHIWFDNEDKVEDIMT